MTQSPRQTLCFSPFRITPDVDLLYQGAEVVPLEPQAVRVLRYLAEHPDRVISKEELLERVWPDVFTTDGVLKKAISQARRALGDEADHARFIQTFHGRGYRFIAPVTAELIEGPAEVAESPPQPAEQMTLALPLAAVDPDYDQLVGREIELAALCAEYRRTLEGTGRPILILGEAGIGKTLLARHFWQWAGEQGALCVYGRFFDYRGSRRPSYEVFLNFLRIALGLAKTDARGRFESGQLTDLRQIVEARCGVKLPEELFVESSGATGGLSSRGNATAGDHFRFIVPLSKCFVRL
jgi:DNA-binding winged helix-turn-helix (wHTH) protein